LVIHAGQRNKVTLIFKAASFKEAERLLAIKDRQFGQPNRLSNRLFMIRDAFLAFDIDTDWPLIKSGQIEREITILKRARSWTNPRDPRGRGLKCCLNGLPAWQRAFLVGHDHKILRRFWCIRLPSPFTELTFS
jgi:hypothetical protein